MIYCPEGFLADEARRSGLTVHSGNLGILGIFKLVRLIRRHRFDIVNTVLLGAAVIGGISAILSGISPRLVVTVNNAILYPGITWWRRLLVVTAYRFVNSLDPIYFSKSNRVREELLGLVRVSSKRVHAIPNPIPLETMPPLHTRARVRAELDIKDGEIAIGVIGKLVPQKGHRYLIEAAPAIVAYNPAVRFYFVGDGPLRSKLEQGASHVCPGRFRFLGNREESARYALAMDIVVIPSIFEGLPNVLLEALAVGKPVVSTAVGGCDEVIQDGENGILAQAGDAQSLIRCICRLLDHPEIAEQIGKRGQESVRRRFEANKVASEVGALIEEASRKTEATSEDMARGRAVLLLISSSDVGGAQTHVAWLAQDGLRNGIRMVVACPPGPLLGKLLSNGAEVYVLRFGFLAAIRIASIVRKIRPKIVHVHLLGAALHGTIGSLLANGPLIAYTVHNLVIYPGMKAWKRYMFPFITRMIARWIGQFIVVSDEIGQFLVQSLRISQDKVRLIHNGISFSGLEQLGSGSGDIRQKIGVATSCHLLGTVGRITFQKGHEFLIEALRSLASEFPALHCIIVGDGDQREEIERLIREFRIQDRVHLVGFQQDVLSWYRAMDIVAFPSRFEGLPITVIEAAYAGRPVIATDVGGVKEIVQDGVTGLLVPPEDSIALVNGIRRLLNDPSFAEMLGRQARAIAIDRFDVQKCSEKTISVYEELLVRTKRS
jgi:glycosyltransferase involved in cell wall biosynthesis